MISNNNYMLSNVIRREERLALKDRSLTADKDRSWFEPTIRICVGCFYTVLEMTMWLYVHSVVPLLLRSHA